MSSPHQQQHQQHGTPKGTGVSPSTSRTFWNNIEKSSTNTSGPSSPPSGSLKIALASEAKMMTGALGLKTDVTHASAPNVLISQNSPVASRQRSATIAVEPSSVPIGSSSIPKTNDQMRREEDDRRKKEDMLRSLTLEHQRKLEEEERKLIEEEQKLKEEEFKLEQEKIRRKNEEQRKLENKTSTSSSTNSSNSGTLRLDSSTSSSLNSSAYSTGSTKPAVVLTDREKDMLIYISELRNTIEKLNKQNFDLVSQLQDVVEHNRNLEHTIEQQRDEIRSLKQLQDIQVGSPGQSVQLTSPKEERKSEKMDKLKRLKLFGSRSGSKENLTEDSTSPLARKRPQSTDGTLSPLKPSSPSQTLREELLSQLPQDDADKKLSLESITKADMIKEMLGNKYSSFALLRKNQIEQLETRRAQASTVRSRSNTADSTSLTNALKGSEPEKSPKVSSEIPNPIEAKKAALNNLLSNRQAKIDLEAKGILTSATFGSSLEILVHERGVPLFLVRAFTFLETKAKDVVNLFQEAVDPTEVQNLKQHIQGGNLNLASLTDNPHLVAALILEFFKDLPDPLFPYGLYKSFVSWIDIDDYHFKITALRSLIQSMPAEYRGVLIYLMVFFHKYVSRAESRSSEAINKVSEVFGPILLRPVSSKNEDYLKQLESLLKESNDDQHAGEIIIRIMLTNYGKVFAEDKDIKFMKKDGSEIVSAATLPKLIDLLLDEYYKESHYVESFLMTHQYYIESSDLLQKLIILFKQDCSPSWQKRRRAKIVRVLKTWVGLFSGLVKSDTKFIDQFKSFAEEVHQLTQKNEKVFEKFLAVVDNGDSRPHSGSQLEPLDLDVLEIEPQHVAEQLSYIDHDLLRAIQPHEFLKKAFTDPSRAPSFNTMVESWNKRSLWVVTEVLKREKLPKRITAIVHFIKIAEICRDLNNFHGCYSILAGLSHVTVSRLEKTWEKVPKKNKNALDSLLALFEMSYNYKSYRTALATASGAIVPYLGLFPKDITSLEEMPTKIDTDHMSMINFSKFRELYSIISQIARYTSSKYKFEKNPELVNFLANVKIFQEKKLMELSEVYEPRLRKKTIDEGEKDDSKSPIHTSRSSKKITAQEIDEYKKNMIEKYEQQQQDSRNMLKLRQELSKPSEDDDVIIHDVDNEIPAPLHGTVRINESRESISDINTLRPRSLTEEERKFMNAQSKVKDLFKEVYTASNGTFRQGQLERLAGVRTAHKPYARKTVHLADFPRDDDK